MLQLHVEHLINILSFRVVLIFILPYQLFTSDPAYTNKGMLILVQLVSVSMSISKSTHEEENASNQ